MKIICAAATAGVVALLTGCGEKQLDPATLAAHELKCAEAVESDQFVRIFASLETTLQGSPSDNYTTADVLRKEVKDSPQQAMADALIKHKDAWVGKKDVIELTKKIGKPACMEYLRKRAG